MTDLTDIVTAPTTLMPLLALDFDGSMPFFGEWNEGTSLVPTLPMGLPEGSNSLEVAFTEANVGESGWARIYREMGNRSLSVGDAVIVNDRNGRRAYRCDAVGWTEVDIALVDGMTIDANWYEAREYRMEAAKAARLAS